MQKLLLSKSNPKKCVTYFVLLLTFSFPTNALASIIQIGDKTQLLSIGVLDVMPLSGDYELTSSIILDPAVEDDNPATIDTYIKGTFTGTFDGNGHTISDLTRPLFDDITGNPPTYDPSTDSWMEEDKAIVKDLVLVTSGGGVLGKGILANDANSYVLIENVGTKGIIVGSTEDSVGGIVGSLTEGFETSGLITKSFSTANVTGNQFVGGLVGKVGSNGTISESYAAGDITGDSYIGGLAGSVNGTISESYAVGDVTGDDLVGGLIGDFNGSQIINTYASGDVIGDDLVGGLVGQVSSGIIRNSYSMGDVTGDNYVGGVLGFLTFDTVERSSATGDVVGVSNMGRDYGSASGRPVEILGTGSLNGVPYAGALSAPIILDVVNFGLETAAFAISPEINSGHPYLISLFNSYFYEEDVENQPTQPNLDISLRYVIAKSNLLVPLDQLGFKSYFSSSKDGIKIFTKTDQNNLSNIQLFEISDSFNATILLSKNEAFQLSISSYAKEPIEIWIQTPSGENIFLGIVEFSSEGKAILPPIKFDESKVLKLITIKATGNTSDRPNFDAKKSEIIIEVF